MKNGSKKKRRVLWISVAMVAFLAAGGGIYLFNWGPLEKRHADGDEKPQYSSASAEWVFLATRELEARVVILSARLRGLSATAMELYEEDDLEAELSEMEQAALKQKLVPILEKQAPMLGQLAHIGFPAPPREWDNDEQQKRYEEAVEYLTNTRDRAIAIAHKQGFHPPDPPDEGILLWPKENSLGGEDDLDKIASAKHEMKKLLLDAMNDTLKRLEQKVGEDDSPDTSDIPSPPEPAEFTEADIARCIIGLDIPPRKGSWEIRKYREFVTDLEEIAEMIRMLSG